MKENLRYFFSIMLIFSFVPGVESGQGVKLEESESSGSRYSVLSKEYAGIGDYIFLLGVREKCVFPKTAFAFAKVDENYLVSSTIN